MSSFATAATRTPEKETPSGKQLHLLVNPGVTPDVTAPNAATPPPEKSALEAAAVNPQTIDEITRVERLLTQLEARSMALVPYGYGTLREAPSRKSKKGLWAGMLVAIWLTTLVLAIAYIRYIGHSPFATERAASNAPPLIVAPDPDPQEQKVAASVDHLAKALVSSSERMNELQAAVEKSNRDLQKIASKVTPDHSSKLPADSKIDSSDSSLSTVVVEPTIPKNWHKVLDVKPTDLAVAHKTADGSIDYWLVPRGSEASPSKVLPIGTSAEGVVVHNLEDGKDYTLTPSGEWRNGALTPSGN